MTRVRTDAELLALLHRLDAPGKALFRLLLLSKRQQEHDRGPTPPLPLSAEIAPPVVAIVLGRRS